MTLLPNPNDEPIPTNRGQVIRYIREKLGCGLIEAANFYEQGSGTWQERLGQAVDQAKSSKEGYYIPVTERKIRDAIQEYYKALDEHKHGGAAAQKALDEIQEILGMSWKRGASKAADTSPGLCQEIVLPGNVQPCVLDPETIIPKL